MVFLPCAPTNGIKSIRLHEIRSRGITRTFAELAYSVRQAFMIRIEMDHLTIRISRPKIRDRLLDPSSKIRIVNRFAFHG